MLKAVRLERGDARRLKYKDPETGKMRYFLQVICPEFQLPYIKNMLKTLDLPGVESASGNTYYHVRTAHRDAIEIGDVIRGTVLSGEGFLFADDVTNNPLHLRQRKRRSTRRGDRQVLRCPPPQVEIAVWAIEIDEDDEATLGCPSRKLIRDHLGAHRLR